MNRVFAFLLLVALTATVFLASNVAEASPVLSQFVKHPLRLEQFANSMELSLFSVSHQAESTSEEPDSSSSPEGTPEESPDASPSESPDTSPEDSAEPST